MKGRLSPLVLRMLRTPAGRRVLLTGWGCFEGKCYCVTNSKETPQGGGNA